MFYASPVWTPLKYDDAGVKEVHSKFFNPFKNTYSFFQMYANTDGIDINECNIPVSNREEIDKWLLSKYNKLLDTCTKAYDEFDLNEVVKAITNFVSDDLSNWYIRRNRDRFWSSELNDSKKSVYMTTYEVLVGLCKICAPIIPYTTEEIYKNLTGEESVHLSDFPVADMSLIDEEIETKMDLVRNLISNGRCVREETKIKVRQPISECLIDGKYENVLGDLVNLIHEELNVKKVTFVDDLSQYMNFTVKPNFKIVGKVLGPKMKEFGERLESLTEEEFNTLNNGGVISVNLSGEDFEVNKEMIDIRISSKEGFNVGMENNDFIILNTTLTDDLIKEGIAREFISKVQNMRKSNDYNIVDRIKVSYEGDSLVKEAISDYYDFISTEVLATSLTEETNIKESFDLNGHETKITIEKAN